jgi:Resolvase, N terminal domain
VLCWKLDRLGRNVRHLVMMLDELRALNLGFTTLAEGIDTTTPAGRMVTHFLAAVAEFERERLRERTHLGLDRARAQGKHLGRPKKIHAKSVALGAVAGLAHRDAANRLGVSVATVKRMRRAVRCHSYATVTRWLRSTEASPVPAVTLDQTAECLLDLSPDRPALVLHGERRGVCDRARSFLDSFRGKSSHQRTTPLALLELALSILLEPSLIPVPLRHVVSRLLS